MAVVACCLNDLIQILFCQFQGESVEVACNNLRPEIYFLRRSSLRPNLASCPRSLISDWNAEYDVSMEEFVPRQGYTR